MKCGVCSRKIRFPTAANCRGRVGVDDQSSSERWDLEIFPDAALSD